MIDALEDALHRLDEELHPANYELYVYLHDVISQAIDQRNEWISVDERLPNHDGRYFIMYRHGKRIWKPFVSDYSVIDGWLNLLGDITITHWKPVQPPAEDE